jgi:integration host factor subunit alpha
LAKVIHLELGISLTKASVLVEDILRHMCQALSSGESVKIVNFGSFLILDKAEKMGRNPMTFEPFEIPPPEQFKIPPRRALTFRASRAFGSTPRQRPRATRKTSTIAAVPRRLTRDATFSTASADSGP